MDYPPQAPKRQSKRKSITIKKAVVSLIVILFIAFIVSISAITHKFGPYMGKVVDFETGEPLEGAAVVMCFKTRGFEDSGSYAGAVEVVTDANGEFNIHDERVFVFHPLSRWDLNGYVTIFKPGYGAYPRHDDSTPMFVPNGSIPENQYVTIKLPKLKTMEERKNNLFNVSLWADVPDKKVKNILRLRSQERVDLGFSPLPASRYGE